VAAVSRDLVPRGLDAGKILREAAQVVGGSGGGRPEMAQAGGKDPNRLEEALERAVELFKRALEPGAELAN
jgi:alanyl-tRNA synthetase